MELAGKKVIISGGAGFIGRALVARLLPLGCRITVVSRDEDKHLRLRREYPEVETRVCDVRDLDMLSRYTAGHDVGIWAASLKQIETCVHNRRMAKEVILDGALNARRVSEDHLEAAVFISTDKSKAPTTLYGFLKGAAGESFILESSRCRLTTAVYGNVWNSTGSVVPCIWDGIRRDRELTLFSDEMTRFMVDAGQAVQIILDALDHNGCYVVPKLESFRVRDLFELYREQFGLRYTQGRPRPSEKIHEVMATAEEVPRMRWVDLGGRGMYLTDPSTIHDQVRFDSGEYSSRDHVVSKARLREILEARDHFKPA